MKEKEKYVGNAVREENKRKVIKSSVATVIILAVLLGVLLVTGVIEKMTDTESLSQGLKEFAGIEDEKTGFPVSFSTNDIVDVGHDGKRFYVLTEKFVTPVDEKGQTGDAQHFSYAQGALFAQHGYAAVFDRFSNKYIFIDKKGNVQQRTDENSDRIYALRVTEKGEVMLSLAGTSSSSMLHVTDKKGEDLLLWSCADEYIVAFDKDGDYIYCAALGAFSGEIYTRIYVLKTGEQEPVFEYTIPAAACIGLNHISAKKFSVLTKDALYICNSAKEDPLQAKISFASEISFYDIDSQNNVAVICENKENFTQKLLSVFDSDGKTVYSRSVEDNIKDISLNGKEVSLLYDDSVKTVSSADAQEKQLFFDGRCVGLITVGKKVYCYSLGGVEKAEKE